MGKNAGFNTIGISESDFSWNLRPPNTLYLTDRLRNAFQNSVDQGRNLLVVWKNVAKFAFLPNERSAVKTKLSLMWQVFICLETHDWFFQRTPTWLIFSFKINSSVKISDNFSPQENGGFLWLIGSSDSSGEKVEFFSWLKYRSGHLGLVLLYYYLVAFFCVTILSRNIKRCWGK